MGILAKGSLGIDSIFVQSYTTKFLLGGVPLKMLPSKEGWHFDPAQPQILLGIQ